MFYTIYKITNKINNKIYIGKHQTKDLDDGYMGSGKLITSAIEKYGLENFEKEILFQFDNEADMNAKEAELVTEDFVKKDTNYNLCPGGHGGFGYLNNHYWTENKILERNRKNLKGAISPIARKKAVETRLANNNYIYNKPRKLTEAGRNKIIETNKIIHTGSKRSEETKQKMSIAGSGSNNSQFGTMWITNGKENKKIKKHIDIIPEGWYKGRSVNS